MSINDPEKVVPCTHAVSVKSPQGAHPGGEDAPNQISYIDGPIDLLKHVSNKRFMECWQEIKDKNPPFDKDTYQIEHVRQTFRKEALRRGLANDAKINDDRHISNHV